MEKSEIIEQEESNKILELACNMAVDQISKVMSSSKSFRWIKKDISYKSHSDLCFFYRRKVFSVIIDIQSSDGVLNLTDDKIEKQKLFSQKLNMIPCKYILIKNGEKMLPATEGWNLVNTISGELISENIERNSFSKISEIILRYHCINYIQQYLNSKKNRILTVQYIPDDEPNIWYIDKTGHKTYVLANIENLSENNIDSSIVISKYKKNNGFEAVLSYSMSEDKNYEYSLEVSLKDYIAINKYEQDVLTKCQNIERENIYNLILNAIQQKNISDKQSVCVFQIPGYRDFLLKIHSVFVNNIGLLTKDLAIIPYEFDDDIKNSPHFGIPLYHIDSKDSEFVKRGSMSPDKMIFVGTEYTNISIIKKVSGVGVKSGYDDELSKLNGKINDHNAAVDMLKLIDIYCKYGIEVSEFVLDKLRQGVYDFERGDLKENSEKYNFIKSDEFYSVYDTFVIKYIATLQKISNLPQKTFVNAVKNIVMPKNFVFDFIVPNNTLIDYEKQEFNFIDFRFEKYVISHIDKLDQIVEFRNVLLGQYNRITRQANQLLFRQSDLDKYNYYKNIITEKIKNAESIVLK